ncbi:O-fucosyltransferase 30-like [Tasmannia lanceolata]|uniref:O-fucosyltransferase 30-like n=1 Tax=Tasmannia lanceolata TaxID=3420 RepID=UPI004064407F
MNLLYLSRSSWKKKIPKKPLLFSICLIFIFFFFRFPYTEIPKSVSYTFPQCGQTLDLFPRGERFLWFAPHSGFNNQLSELKNAILMAAILNRTLIIPPVLDHHAVALGSCPKFRVSSPAELRISVWDHIIQLLRTRRYVSMADIVDLSSVVSSSMVRTVDFRVFASLWCGLNMELACFGNLCCALSGVSSLSGNVEQCGSLLSGMEGNVDQCIYAVEEDCRTTIWTYQQNDDGLLDSFQPDEQLQKKKKISCVRRRRDVYKAFGPGSNSEMAPILAFGSLFSAPYKGSELYIDIHEAPRDPQIQSLLQKIGLLPFVPEINNAAKNIVSNMIRAPFLCAQLRLLDGQFKNHWKATFSALKQQLDSLAAGDEGKTSNPIHIFVMTDLPRANWTGTYLGDLESNVNSYKLYNLQESDDIVILTAQKLMDAEHGLRSGFLPRVRDGVVKKKQCPSVLLPDILLYIEEAICSCASLGFVGTAGSTIAESVELMRKNSICLNSSQSKL